MEGLERYRFGVKEPREIDNFGYNSVRLRAKTEGDFEGAQFEERADVTGKKLVARVVPALAVRRKNHEGFVHFTEAEVREGSWLQNTEVDWRLGIKVFGREAATEGIVAILKDQGVVPAKWRPLTPPQDGEVTVEQEFEVTPEMQRALAKIAFNYVTYCEGSKFALLEEFDPIRTFIMRGDWLVSSLPPVLSHGGLPFLKINAGNVVLQDGPERPVVHFVSIGTNVERNLLSAISLFSFMTHRVLLAEEFKGPLPNPRAHLYNVKTLQVGGLGATPRSSQG